MTVATRLTRALDPVLGTVLAMVLGPVLAIALVAGPATASPTAAVDAGTGSTTMPDQVLRRGCRSYPYTYSVSTSTGDWVLETFLLDPDRQRVAAGVFSSDADANPGAASFALCRASTRFGRFKVRGRLTTYDGWDQATAWITPTYVRLHRPGR